MPAINYAKAFVYLLYNTADGFSATFIGSSCSAPEHRLAEHKRSLTTARAPWVATYMRLTGIDTMRLRVLEYVSCTNRLELLEREIYWINAMSPILNCEKTAQYAVDTLRERVALPPSIDGGNVLAHTAAQSPLPALHRASKKIVCACGGSTSAHNWRNHSRTWRHQAYVEWGGLLDVRWA